MKLLLRKSILNNSMPWIATLTVSMLNMHLGIYYGWTSPNTARLLSEDSPIPCTPSDISWLVSLTPIGFFLGSIVGPILVDYTGDRKTLLVTYLLMAISWICVLSAYLINSIGWLYVARLIGGLPATMFWCCGSTYLSRISAPDIRGTLVSLGMAGLPFGYLIGIIIETYMFQTISSLIYLSFILFAIVLLLCLRDSQYFLVQKGDIENAKKSIMFYRKNVNVDEELKEIRMFVEKNDSSLKDKLSQLRQPAVKRAILIIIIAFALPDSCGGLTVASYTEIILTSSGFNYIKPEQWVIYSYAITLSTSFFTVRVLDKFGRKAALIISSIGVAVTLGAIGLQFYFLKSGADIQYLQWVSVSSLLLYGITYNVGYITVPCTLLSEIFPTNIQSIASLIATMSGSICAFVAVKAYQPVADYIGVEYMFWIHAIISLTGIPFALLLMIETKGRTFQEIQDKLAKK